MEPLIKKLQLSYPHLVFTEAEVARWSPSDKVVYYTTNEEKHSSWTLLHETGHALLDHRTYENDVDLLRKELSAWLKAIEIANVHSIKIDQEYIDYCLDSYRDWVHRRSTCPACNMQGLQDNHGTHYKCPNCANYWRVSKARFCRPYRRHMAPI